MHNTFTIIRWTISLLLLKIYPCQAKLVKTSHIHQQVKLVPRQRKMAIDDDRGNMTCKRREDFEFIKCLKYLFEAYC